MTAPTAPDHYRAASSATLLDVALELSEMLGSLEEHARSASAALEEDDRLSPAARAAMRPFIDRMGQTMADTVGPLIRDEVAVIRGLLADRPEAVDAMIVGMGRVATHRATAADAMVARTETTLVAAEARLAEIEAELAGAR